MRKQFNYSVRIALNGRYSLDTEVKAGSAGAAKAKASALVAAANPNYTVEATAAYLIGAARQDYSVLHNVANQGARA